MSKQLNIDLKLVRELAAMGHTPTMVLKAIGCSRSYFYKHIRDEFELARDKARAKVIANLFSLSSSDNGASATKYLCEKLHVFDEYVPTTKPKGAKEVLSKMGDIFVLVANNDLSTEKADKLMIYLEKILKSYEVSELAESVASIQAQLDEQKRS